MTTSEKQAPVIVEKPVTGINLLKNVLVSGIFKSRWFPGILQWPTAFVFMLIIYVLLFGTPLAHGNFGIALTWVLWWPLIPIIFILVGRFWCAICPFGALSDFVQKFVGHNRPVPGFLKKYGIWVIDAMFILITWGDHVFGIVSSPWGSGILLLMIVTAVTASAVLWERRTWCRHLCFLGGLSANYSQAGMMELKGTPEKCSKCNVSACYKGSEKAPGCPMFEYPRTMATMAECNLCGYCVKSCPNDSLTLKVRMPTQELWSIRKPHFATAFLAAVIMGIVFVQNVTMLSIWQPIMDGVAKISHSSNFDINFTIVFIIFMALPILLLGLASYIAKKVNRGSIVQNFAKFGYSIIALDVAAHIAHNLFHLFAEGGNIYITGAGLFGKTVQNASPALLSTPTIQIIQFALLALGMAGSIYTAYRVSRSNFADKKWATVIPFWVLIVLLGVANFIFFSMPMSHRM